MWMTDDGITDVPISLNDCDKLIENYAKHALDFSAADHCNEPGKYCFTHTHLFNGPLSGITRVSRYQKGKTNLDFTEARDSE